MHDYQPTAVGFAEEAKSRQRWLRRFALAIGAGISGVIMVTALMGLLAKPAGADQLTLQAPISVQGPAGVSAPLTASVPLPVSLPTPVNVAAPVSVPEPTVPTSVQPAAVIGGVTGTTGALASSASTTVGALTTSTSPTLAPVVSPIVGPVVAGGTKTLAPVTGLATVPASSIIHAAVGGGSGSEPGVVTITAGALSPLSAFPALTSGSMADSTRSVGPRGSGTTTGGPLPRSPLTPTRAPAPSTPPSPQAPSNAGESLVSGQGNTPFGSLPPSMLLLPALALGAVMLLRNRTPKLLLDLRFAPPG